MKLLYSIDIDEAEGDLILDTIHTQGLEDVRAHAPQEGVNPLLRQQQHSLKSVL